MKSNVVPLFKEPELTTPTSMDNLLNMITDWSEAEGADIRSTKFKYEMATIGTLLGMMTR